MRYRITSHLFLIDNYIVAILDFLCYLTSIKMSLKFVFISSLFLTIVSNTSLLSRHKRYLVFPEGASLSLAICMTNKALTSLPFFTHAVVWGVAYDLPNDTTAIRNFIKPKKALQRRHRRDIYQKMEVIMDSMGYNGRSCIYRTLCETARYLPKGSDSLIDKLFGIIFNFPTKQLLNSEPEQHRLYHWAYRMGRSQRDRDCAEFFPDCPFSLLGMMFGRTEPVNDT